MQKYENILITGANSFLGTNVAIELSSRAVKMRAIVRHTNAVLDTIEGLQIIRGNVANYDDLLQAATGCDCIVHIAAITDQSIPRYATYRDFNVGVLENVIRVARQTGIKRVIFVSSANAIGNGTPEHPADETCPVRPPFSTMLYGRSKVEAEATLRCASDLDYTILNPTFMLGAHDTKPSSGQIILMGYGRRVIIATPGGKNVVSVRAAAIALCNAIDDARVGENYLLAGVDISLRDFFRKLNKRAIIIVIPSWILFALGYVGDMLRFFGIHTQLSSSNLRVVCTKEYYTGAKAQKELNMPLTSVDECMEQAVEWFIEQGRIKRR